MQTSSRAWAAVAAVLAWCGCASEAFAYTTRVHIVLANQVRDALIASGDGTIPLRLSPHAVRLPQADADAIEAYPLAFRAGAVGPDNTVFPGMTDPSHAVHQNPYYQCQLLYEEALTEEETAYALGCFLHGSTDAVVHHFVNHFTGETFTLTPLETEREFGYGNMVGHIVTEGNIQNAVLRVDPEALGGTRLAHAIPRGFVQRAYFDADSPLWLHVSAHAREELEAARAADPGGGLLDHLGAAGLAPADHLVLVPLIVEEIDRQRAGVRGLLEARIAELADGTTADGATLGVTAGPDGVVGTPDDETSCSASCPTLAATYHLYVALLAPRLDAGGRELPSAFDKLSDELGDDLHLFVPALLQTIEGLSAELNSGVTAESSGFDLDEATLLALLGPMDDWVTDVTTLDYETLARSALPAWLIDLEDLLSSIGVTVDLGALLRQVFAPVIDDVKEAIQTFVVDEVRVFLSDFLAELEARRGSFETALHMRLDEAADPALGGDTLDYLYESGLWTHSFNIAAATFANHELLVLTEGELGAGAASFDASYTLSWTQAGLCDHLREAVFPMGLGVDALLSVRLDDQEFRATPPEGDSPVECHDGSLASFGVPSAESCAMTSLDALVADAAHRGSVTRAFPPAFATSPPACLGTRVPGLPEPPPPPPGEDAGVPVDGGPDADAGTGGGKGGCAVAGAPAADPGAALWLLLVGLALAARRRRLRLHVAVLAALVAACGGGGGDAPPPEDAAMDGVVPTDGGPMDAGPPDVGPSDVGPPDASDLRRALLDALGDSVWSGLQSRTEGASLVERAYEIEFRASSLEWAEIRNPFGPARRRRLRSFSVDRDGRTVQSTVMSPDGWPADPQNGDRESWTFEIVPGDPRVLRVTDADGLTEEFVEGAWPAPETGLTARLRVFPSGAVNDAFCDSGFSAFDRGLVWSFGRGGSVEPELGSDLAAGVTLESWNDPSGANRFAVTDVAGFDRLGGTLLSDQFNFVVTYTGTLSHAGGAIAMREEDDSVEDGVWAWIWDGVGSANSNDLFLEVHGFVSPDLTADEPSVTVPAGDVPVEIMLIRCDMEIRDVTVQMRIGGGAWTDLRDVATTPIVTEELFPPAL